MIVDITNTLMEKVLIDSFDSIEYLFDIKRYKHQVMNFKIKNVIYEGVLPNYILMLLKNLTFPVNSKNWFNIKGYISFSIDEKISDIELQNNPNIIAKIYLTFSNDKINLDSGDLKILNHCLVNLIKNYITIENKYK